MLILPIKGKWFNMILSGDKREEYREIKPYYTTRFKKIFEMYPNSNIHTGLDKQLIGFRNGYGSSRPQFTAVCSLDVKTGNGHIGIYERKSDSSYPIKQLYGPSVPRMAENAVVLKTVEDRVNEVINNRMEHELDRILNGGS